MRSPRSSTLCILTERRCLIVCRVIGTVICAVELNRTWQVSRQNHFAPPIKSHDVEPVQEIEEVCRFETTLVRGGAPLQVHAVRRLLQR